MTASSGYILFFGLTHNFVHSNLKRHEFVISDADKWRYIYRNKLLGYGEIIRYHIEILQNGEWRESRRYRKNIPVPEKPLEGLYFFFGELVAASELGITTNESLGKRNESAPTLSEFCMFSV